MNCFKYLIIYAVVQSLCFGELLTPPFAKKYPVEKQIFKDKFIDDYAWMESPFNEPETLAYVDAENFYSLQSTLYLQNLQKILFNEMQSHQVQNKIFQTLCTYGRVLTTLYSTDNYEYFLKTSPTSSYPSIARKNEQSEEILVNLDTFAEKMENFSLAISNVDPSEKFLAFTYDEDGSMSYNLAIKDIVNNVFLKDHLQNVAEDFIWSKDGNSIFYLEVNGTTPFRLKKHKLGTEQNKDLLIYEEKDPHLYLKISPSTDNSLIFISSLGQSYSEVRFLFNDTDSLDPILILNKKEDLIYFAEKADENSFYILTNENAINFKIDLYFYKTKEKKEFFKTSSANIEKMVPLKDYLVLQVRENALPYIKVIDLKNPLFSKEYKFDETVYNLQLDRGNFYKNSIRYSFSSPITPTKIIDLDLKNEKTYIVQRETLGQWFDPDKYVTKQIFTISHDGKKIPISLFYKRGITFPNNMYLMVYGAYGDNFNLSFSSYLYSLVDRDIIVAVAHVRGGGELGPSWYIDGKLLQKKNSFLDFISCSEHLIEQNYTVPDKLIIYGRSAGGLVVGTTLNWAPELFKAAITEVPFVGSIAFSNVSNSWDYYEQCEWGNFELESDFSYFKSYSPYHNIKIQQYPSILVLTSIHDSIVPYYEPLKWVAKIRASKTDNNPLYLVIDKKQGHKNKSNSQEQLKYNAFVYSFILDQMLLHDLM